MQSVKKICYNTAVAKISRLWIPMDGAEKVPEEMKPAEEKPKGEKKMSVISMKQLLEAGVPVTGSRCSFRTPDKKMEP